MGGSETLIQCSAPAAGPSTMQNVEELSASTTSAPAKPLKVSKPRIDCIDGCRFALVLPICVGHFIRFGTDRRWLLALLTQENVLVGGFFIISGYVAGYVSTNFGERSHDKKKLEKPELFFWQKVMGYYPLHAVVSTAFAPMFIWLDRMTNSWRNIGFRACLNYSLLQAWFPTEAEIWNPPTWFLSALTFANLSMPFVLPPLATLSKDGLHKVLAGLTALSVLGKVAYSQAWSFVCKGAYRQKPSLPRLWNITRFHPFWALTEIVMGIAAVRDVMLDDPAEKKEKRTNPLWYFIGSYASLGLRLTQLNLNDAIIRSVFFVPLYIKFLTTLHRDCLSEKPRAITRFFGTKLMGTLGSIAFPMFVLHGPIGQLFYKKKVAERLWGQVMPKSFFPMYLMIVMLASVLANETFVKNKAVQRWSAKAAQFMAKLTEGMLQDRGDSEAK